MTIKLGFWTDDENNIIAAEYMRNLGLEKNGIKYNKAASRREGLATMGHAREDGRTRSHGSWEMKCCNISAVLQAAGLPWINGYKPLGHGQAKPLARALLPWALAYGFNDSEIARLGKLAE